MDDAMTHERYERKLAELDKALALMGKDVASKLGDDDRREIENFVEKSNSKILGEVHRLVDHVREDSKVAVVTFKELLVEQRSAIRQERMIEFGEFEKRLFEKLTQGRGGVTGFIISFGSGGVVVGGILFMLWLNGMLGG